MGRCSGQGIACPELKFRSRVYARYRPHLYESNCAAHDAGRFSFVSDSIACRPEVLSCAWEGMRAEDTMRPVSVVLSLALIALVVSPAQAQYRHHLYNFSGALPRYESCDCHFGYNGNAGGECTPTTACSSMGGRCTASCTPQTGSEWYRSP